MRHLAAVAVVLAGMALPACTLNAFSRGGSAGHGGSGSRGSFGGGSAGRASAGFRGGAGASAPARYSGVRRYAGPGYAGTVRPGVARGLPMGNRYNYGAQSGYPAARTSRYRRPYRPPYGAGYGYGGGAWVDPYLLGYPDDFGYDDSGTAPYYAADGYDSQPDEPAGPDEQAPYLPYQYNYGQSADVARPESRPQSLPGSAAVGDEGVTLVFKDGRPREQIHNYMLSRTTLSVLDKRHQEIPVDELDLAATAKANRDAGVDFRLPGDSK